MKRLYLVTVASLLGCAQGTSDVVPDARVSQAADAAGSVDAASGLADAAPQPPDAIVVPDAPPAAAAQLVFSEYVEGSSSNKALEIYNRGSQAVALSRCSVARYNNGGTSPNQTQALDMLASVGGGTPPTMLAAKAVLVIADPSATSAIDAVADGSSGITAYNGNDALELICDDNVVDSFGQVGNDPITEWTGGGVGTLDVTLRRSCSATGRTASMSPFDPSAEWTEYSIDDFTGLGAHSCP